MNPKSILAQTALTLAITLVLIGCSPRQAPPAPTDAPAGPAPQPQAITPIAHNNALSDIAASPEGLYRVQQVRPASVNLFYIDAATKREMYLCAAPNCSHDSDACTSYLPLTEQEYGYQLFFHNGFLYIVQCAATTQHAPYIMRANPDGSGREKVVELNSGENFFGLLFGYGDSILTEIGSVSENGTGGLCLEQINLQTGAREPLLKYDLPERQYCSVMGAAGSRLIYLSIDETGYQYFWVDPCVKGQSLADCRHNAPLTGVYDGQALVYTVQNGYLCGLNRSAGQLSYENLITREKKEFSFQPWEQGDQLFGLYPVCEDIFALSLDAAAGTLICALLDPQTGSQTGVRYEQTREHAVEPVAAFGDTLLYRARDAEAPLKGQEDFGLMGEMYYYSVYGAVSKEMFLRGEPGTEIAFPAA